MSKFTPWKYVKEEQSNGRLTLYFDTVRRADTDDASGNICRIHNEAEARLISAAPDMYEALKGMIELVNTIDRYCPPEDDTWTRANEYVDAIKALAKADSKA